MPAGAALELGKPALKVAKGAYAAELGILVAARLTASDSPRIPTDLRFCPFRAACGTGFPSQVEPHPPAPDNASPLLLQKAECRRVVRMAVGSVPLADVSTLGHG